MGERKKEIRKLKSNCWNVLWVIGWCDFIISDDDDGGGDGDGDGLSNWFDLFVHLFACDGTNQMHKLKITDEFYRSRLEIDLPPRLQKEKDRPNSMEEAER